ncbi:MAG: ABC transporter [Crocinitomicaceae bacterium]|nr:ABC transporter [Crocinitomicaceae bacterium]
MKSLSYLNKYFFKYKWRLLLGVIFTVFSNYFAVKMPIYVKETIDSFMDNINIQGLNDSLIFSLKIGAIYMLFSFGKGLFLFLMRQTIIVVSRFIEFDLKNEIYKHYQKLDTGFYKKHSTGDLMNRISEDVSKVRMYLGPGIMYSVNLVILSSMVIYQMIQINSILTIYVLLPLPIMSFLIYKVSATMNRLSTEVQKEQSMLSTIAQESFSGIRVLKAYNREKETNKKFNYSTDAYKEKSMKLVLVNALFMPTILFLIGLSTIISIYVGGNMSFNNEISLGGIVAFIFYVNNLTWPFASIGWVTSIVQRASASQKRINEFLDTKPKISNYNFGDFIFDGKIEFKNVHFTYPETNIKAVDNLSFKIKKGDVLGIIGKTGSGKSTILNLLLNKYEVDQGEILLDDQKIKTVNTFKFFDQCGVVPQEVFLFSDTINNNLLFSSNKNISDEKIIAACKDAKIFDNIMGFPHKMETLLGERGVNLSGGQKQRLSIARALIREPKLLLFDDCLSAVDTETEEAILENIDKKSKERTNIIVSHRISSIRNANHILVIENGSIIEQGSHKDLLSLKGFYSKMYEQQLND